VEVEAHLVLMGQLLLILAEVVEVEVVFVHQERLLLLLVIEVLQSLLYQVPPMQLQLAVVDLAVEDPVLHH
tara:strand:+ start:158 stop:370 length:213 start_codon:yes stop_codon:yes gene_type:complete